METSKVKSMISSSFIKGMITLFIKRVVQRTAPRAIVAMTAVGGPFDYQAQFHHMETEVIGTEIPVATIEMLDIANSLPRNPSKSYPLRNPSIVTGYVVHHTGVPPQEPVVIAKYHINKKGWAGIAYHFGIYKGKVLILNDVSVISNHTAGRNTKNVGVVVFGDYRKMPPSKEDLKALQFLDDHLDKNGIKSMTWHRAVKATECPGDSLILFLKTMKRNELLVSNE